MKILKAFIRCAAAASICVMSLASCSDQGFLAPAAPDLNKQFQMTAQVSCGDSVFTADFSRTGIGQWQVMLTEPYEVQGVSFSYSGGAVSASFGEFSAETLTADFAASPPALIISAFEDTVQDAAANVAYQSESYTVQSGSCLLTFRQGGSAPTAMELPGLRAEITDFRITGDIFPDGADVVVVE